MTNEDVKRVANEVFVDTNRTVGILETTSAAKGHSDEDEILTAAMSAALLLGSAQAQERSRERCRERSRGRNAPASPPTGGRSQFPHCPRSSRSSPNALCCPMGWSSS